MPYKDPAKQKEAIRKSVLKWKREHPEKAKAQAKQYSQRKYAVRKALLAQIKGVPCMDCGQSFPPYVMDFDHREPEKKRDHVGRMVAYATLADLLEEISKCDIVCANCHRVRTHSE